MVFVKIICAVIGAVIALVGSVIAVRYVRARQEIMFLMKSSSTDLVGTDEEIKAGQASRDRLIKLCRKELLTYGPDSLYWVTLVCPVLLGRHEAVWWIEREKILAERNNSFVVQEFINESAYFNSSIVPQAIRV